METNKIQEEVEIEPYYLEYTEICNRCKKEHKFFMFKRVDRGHGTRLCCLDCYFKQIREDTLEKVKRELEGDRIYPKDIFPEVTKKQLSQIQNFLEQRQGFPLDRLSAHIGRQIVQGMKLKIGDFFG